MMSHIDILYRHPLSTPYIVAKPPESADQCLLSTLSNDRLNFLTGADSNTKANFLQPFPQIFPESVMERPVHSMSNLFAQLGQATDEISITQFINSHSPLPAEVRLHEASFWSSAQATFLKSALMDDADWAEVADELNRRLHDGH